MRSKWFQPHSELPSQVHQPQKEEIPQHPAVKTSGNYSQEGCGASGDSSVLSKGMCTYSLTHKLTCYGLQCRISSPQNARDIQGKTKLTSFRARARGSGVRAALSKMELLSGTIVSWLSNPPTKSAGAGRYQICALYEPG